MVKSQIDLFDQGGGHLKEERSRCWKVGVVASVVVCGGTLGSRLCLLVWQETMNDGAAASCSASCRTTPMKAVPSRAQAATMVEEMVVTLTLSLTVMAMANAMATGTKIN